MEISPHRHHLQGFKFLRENISFNSQCEDDENHEEICFLAHLHSPKHIHVLLDTDKYEDADGLLTATSIRMSCSCQFVLSSFFDFQILIPSSHCSGAKNFWGKVQRDRCESGDCLFRF
jgi:hypothetical protein